MLTVTVPELTPAFRARLPLNEQLMDVFADALVSVNDAQDIAAGASGHSEIVAMRPRIQAVYDQLNFTDEGTGRLTQMLLTAASDRGASTGRAMKRIGNQSSTPPGWNGRFFAIIEWSCSSGVRTD